MNILTTQYDLERYSIDIFLAGCKGNPHCKNCYNPESWDFSKGILLNNTFYDSIREKVNTYPNIITKFSILGGEPLDQELYELSAFIHKLKTFDREVWVYTRYALKDIPKILLEKADYIKCGRYLEEFKADNYIQYGVKLATTNQKIYKKGVDY